MALALNRLKSQKSNVMVPDSISHSSGTVSVVFGTTTYTLVLSGLSSNTRYQIYLVPGGTLVQSTNENSVGPAGYTSWILVGAFYADAATSVGGFLNLLESPKAYMGTETFVPTTGTGTMTNYTASMSKWRDEDRLIQRFSVKFTGSVGTWTDVSIPVAAGLSINAAKVNGADEGAPLGTLELLDSGSEFYYGRVQYKYNTSDSVRLLLYSVKSHTGTVPLPGSPISNLFPMSFVSTDSINGVFEVPISGWSNTPVAYL